MLIWKHCKARYARAKTAYVPENEAARSELALCITCVRKRTEPFEELMDALIDVLPNFDCGICYDTLPVEFQAKLPGCDAEVCKPTCKACHVAAARAAQSWKPLVCLVGCRRKLELKEVMMLLPFHFFPMTLFFTRFKKSLNDGRAWAWSVTGSGSSCMALP
jgi:hypothetical protein